MEINNSDIFKQREFSELISDTLNFYIREAKSLIKYIFKYALLFIIVKSLVSRYYSYVIYFEYEHYSNFFELLRYGSRELIGFVLILKAVNFLQYTMLIVVVGSYVKVFADKGLVEKKDISRELKRIFFKVLGSTLLIGIAIILSLIVFILPAIYLAVVFSVVPFIILFENISVRKAMSKSLRIFKGNWWKSLAAFLVISIIYIIFILIVSLIFPRIFLAFGFIPFVFTLSSLITGFLYAVASALPILLAVILYTSFSIEEEAHINKPKKKAVTRKKNKEKKQSKQKKASSLSKENEWTKLQDEDEQKNRFLDNRGTDRFKPKY